MKMSPDLIQRKYNLGLGLQSNYSETETQEFYCPLERHIEIFKGKPKNGYGSNDSLGRVYILNTKGKY